MELDASMRWTGKIPEIGNTSRTGIIAKIGSGPRRAEILKFIKSANIPVVDLEGDDALPEAPKIRLNIDQIANVVVDHFSHRFFQQLTLVVFDDGLFVRALHASLGSMAKGRMEFAAIPSFAFSDWLRTRPSPAAIVASNDLEASKISQICLDAGVKIPEEIAILGIGNDGLLCTSGSIPLSSVEPNHFCLGYAAADLLRQLLRTPAHDREMSLVSPLGVVRRVSTDTIAMGNPLAVQALRTLRNNFRSPYVRWEIERLLGKDACRVERIFRKRIGRTINREIIRLRIEEAKAMLGFESPSIQEIADRCGFGGRYSFEQIFFRHLGCTPRAYRLKLLDESNRYTERPQSIPVSGMEQLQRCPMDIGVLEPRHALGMCG